MDIDLNILRMLEQEKEIKFSVLVEAIEQALLTAYHQTPGAQEQARVLLDQRNGHVTVFAAELDDEGNKVGEYDDTPEGFGRIAATTAKQIMLQRLRDAEDELRFGEFSGKEGDIISGVIQQGRNPDDVMVDLGKLEAILPLGERVPGESYEHGERIKCMVVSVRKGMRGPQITLSRTHPNLVKKLFALEVPEIADGTVEIAAIAREAGHRTKLAVHTRVPGVNAKGSCIGPMGSRVRAVMTELHGEKIDIVDFSDDPAEMVAHALSPGAGLVGGDRSRSSSAPRASWCPTSSCRWRSARRARTPAWPPGSPAGASTSAPTRRRPDGGPPVAGGRRPSRPDADPVHVQGRHQVVVVAVRPLGEVEDRDHDLERVRRRRRGSDVPPRPSTLKTASGAVPVDGVGVEVRDVEVEPGCGEVLGEVGVAEGLEADCPPRPSSSRTELAEHLDDADLPAALRPVLEAASHSDAIERGESRHPAADLEVTSVHEEALEAGLLLADGLPVPERPAARRCCPTGPEKLPDWTTGDAQRGSVVAGHHNGCSTGMSRIRQESPIRHDAALAARELQAGR